MMHMVVEWLRLKPNCWLDVHKLSANLDRKIKSNTLPKMELRAISL